MDMRGYRLIDWGRVRIMAITISAMVGLTIWATAEPGARWTSSEWAAWVQAVGSVAAILAAVLIATWQREADRRQREYAELLEARSLALYMFRHGKKLRRSLHGALKEVMRQGTDAVQWQVKGAVIPQQLWDEVPRMHKLGTAGQQFIRAIYRMDQARDLIDAGVVWPDKFEQYANHLRFARTHAIDAMEATAHLLERP